MFDVGLPFRRLLVAIFAAWLPLACCCRALHAEAPATDDAATHSCCSEAGAAVGPDDAAPVEHGDSPGHGACECDGDARVAPALDAAPVAADLPLVGYLPFWGGVDAESASIPLSVLRSLPGHGDSPSPPTPSLRALSVLLTL